MKVVLSLLFIYSLVFSKVYYAKVEPYEIREISSNTSGLILSTDENMLGKKLSSKAYITIDSQLDYKELNYLKEKMQYLENTIVLNKTILANLDDSLLKKRKNYKKISLLKIKSDIEKDREFHDLVASENQYLNTKKEINNLNIQISDLNLKLAYLKRTIKDKNLIAENFVLYSILVKVGQVVGVSTPLAKVADISSAKLTLYLDSQDILNFNKKIVYIDGKKTTYKISRMLNIADSKNISKYMAQIIIDSPELFSKLVKVELRDE